MRTRVIESLDHVSAASWNRLLDDTNPFVRHEFLAGLEATGCASAETGWHPCHIVCEAADGELLGALPLYLKTNPYGEFVFDYAWAGAYQRAGLAYYPKLVAAVPFTPAAGPRLLTHPDHDRAPLMAELLQRATRFAGETGASSLHLLFPRAQDREALESNGLLLRKDCQFHWHNKGYQSFDDFLATFTAAKRKKTRRERRRIREAGVHFEVKTGAELTTADWNEIIVPYSNTFLMRGREPYLRQEFFEHICATLPDNVVVFMAYQEAALVGVSICFRSATALYGRYWGSNRFVDSLHFETCYYQGIDYCIREGIELFEPGTQGEHKIARGFVPTATWSAHWLSHPQFAAAVDDYLERERAHVDDYMDVLGDHVPYKSVAS